MKTFRRLSMATTAAAIATVTLGAYVRSSGSGLGCPDWPKCHGRWLPPLEAAALIEYSHRLAVSALGILGLIVVAMAWFRFRSRRAIFVPAMMAAGVVLVQAWVGRLVVLKELPRNLVALHFFIALGLLAVLTVMTVNSFVPRGGRFDATTRLSALVTSTVFLALMAGALVSQTGAASAFRDWPLMNAAVIPQFTTPEAALNFAHRVLSLISGAALGYSAVRISRDGAPPVVAALLRIALGLWVLQVAAGASNVFLRSASWTIVIHVFLASLLWVTVVATTVVTYRLSPAFGARKRPVESATPATSTAGRARAYLRLTKPRIIELLLITTVPMMIVAEGGLPALWLIAATLIGGSMAAGSANAINNYLDRDIDQVMPRTAGRPLPRQQIQPASALRFGLILGALGIFWLVVMVNTLSGVLALSAILFYVFVYTLGLKRTTPSNIVIGGAAGAVPVLVGWAAVTGRVEIPALAAFLIVFYWTPPHFWALSLRYSDDYLAAGVPMLPVIRGPVLTARRILLYSVALVGVSLLFAPVAKMGVIYLAISTLLGATFLVFAVRLFRQPNARSAMSLFRFSIVYLTLLFVAMGADRLAGMGRPDSLDGGLLGAAIVILLVSQVAIGWTGLRWWRSGRGLAPT